MHPGTYVVPGAQPVATVATVLSPPGSPPQTKVLPEPFSGGRDGDLDITDMVTVGNPATKQGLYALVSR